MLEWTLIGILFEDAGLGRGSRKTYPGEIIWRRYGTAFLIGSGSVMRPSEPQMTRPVGRCEAIPIMAGMAAPCLPGSMPATQSNPTLSASVKSASPSSTMAGRRAQYAVGLSACIERRKAYADLTRWFRPSPAMKCTTQMAHCKVHSTQVSRRHLN